MKFVALLIASLLAVSAYAKVSFCDTSDSANCKRNIVVRNLDSLNLNNQWLTGYMMVVTQAQNNGKGTWTWSRNWIVASVTPFPRVTIRHAYGTYSLTDGTAGSASVDFNATTFMVGMPAIFLWSDSNKDGSFQKGEQSIFSVPLFTYANAVKVDWNTMVYSNKTDAGVEVHEVYAKGDVKVNNTLTANSFVSAGIVEFNYTIPLNTYKKMGVEIQGGTAKIDKTFTPAKGTVLATTISAFNLGVVVGVWSSSDSGTATVNAQKQVISGTGSSTVTPNVQVGFTSGAQGMFAYEPTAIPYTGTLAGTAVKVSAVEYASDSLNVDFKVGNVAFTGSVARQLYAIGFNASLASFDSLLWDPQVGVGSASAASHVVVSFGAIAAIFVALALVKRM